MRLREVTADLRAEIKVSGREEWDQATGGPESDIQMRVWTEKGALGTGRTLGPEEGVLGSKPRKWGSHKGNSGGELGF